jgi:hypothetical protein
MTEENEIPGEGPDESLASADPAAAVDLRLSEAEDAADEDRLRVLEELYKDLETALEADLDQAGPPGR